MRTGFWKRISAAGLVAVAVALPGTAFGASHSGGDRATVLLKGPASTLASLKAQYGAGFDFGADGFTTQVSLRALAQLQQRGDVFVEVQPTRTVLGKFEGTSGKAATSTARPATPTDQTPWGMEVTYNNTAITSTSGGVGITVAVLDTGVVSHIDLPKPTKCADASNGVVAFIGKCKDGHGHGTHVTGTILANAGGDNLGIYGVAPAASFFAIKVCDNGGSCPAASIAWGIRYAADNGAHIISMSLGGSAMSTAERDAINYASSTSNKSGRAVLVIAAAGNSGSDVNTIMYPGAYYKVVSVASVTLLPAGATDGAKTRDVSATNLAVNSWSSRGTDDPNCATNLQGVSAGAERCLEVAAPGHKVESTMKDGKYAIWSGTSMATPHVSGLAAKTYTTGGGSADAVRSWLQTNATGYDVTQAFVSTGPDTSTLTTIAAGYEYSSGFGNPRVN